MEKEVVGHKLIKTLGESVRSWLADPVRAYPVSIDPSVIVSGGILEAEVQFGGLQRKVAFVNGNWYAFYNDGTDVLAQKSSNGTSWTVLGSGSSDLDSTDADNYNPSVYLSGTTIYVAWIDTSAGLEVNSINTASSDSLGTKCTQSPGTLTSTYIVSVAVASNGTVYLATTDTNSDTVAKVYKLVFSGCTFTDITTPTGTRFYLPDNDTFGAEVTPTFSASWEATTGSPESRRTVVNRANTASGFWGFADNNNTNMDIIFSQYVSDPIAAQTISSQTLKFQMLARIQPDGSNMFTAIGVRVVSNDGTTVRGTILDVTRDDTLLTQTATNRSFSAATTSVTAEDGDRIVIEVGTGGDPSGGNDHDSILWDGDDNATDLPEDDATTTAYNPWVGFANTITFKDSGLTAGDRPVIVTVGNNLHLIYQDGDLSHSVYNGTGWTTSNTTIDSVADSIYSVTTDGTSVWVLAVSGTTSTNFYKCASCPVSLPSWSSLTVPWTSQTNVTSVSITYDLTNSDLYAHVIKDTSEQAYFKSTDATTISWETESSYGFTAGDLGHISAPMTAAGTSQIGVVLRQNINFEFAPVPERTLYLLLATPLAYGLMSRLKKKKNPVQRL